MLTLKQKEFFDENGYFVLDHAFDQEDLKDFKTTFLSILVSVVKRAQKEFPHLKETDLGENGDNALLALRHAKPEYVSIFQRTISRTPEFFRLSSSKQLFKATRELMRIKAESGLYLLSNGIVFTNPNDSDNKRSSNFELDWHQDTFFTVPENRYFQFWGPVLQKSTESLGTLIVCPGSHKNGYGKQRIHPELSYNHRFSMAPGEIDSYDKVSVELEVGQMLIFHGQLIHASGHNVSPGKIRTTMLGLCHDGERETCVPVSTHYLYHEKTPEAWFYEVYKDEKAKQIMFEQLAPSGEPVGGV